MRVPVSLIASSKLGGYQHLRGFVSTVQLVHVYTAAGVAYARVTANNCQPCVLVSSTLFAL